MISRKLLAVLVAASFLACPPEPAVDGGATGGGDGVTGGGDGSTGGGSATTGGGDGTTGGGVGVTGGGDGTTGGGVGVTGGGTTTGPILPRANRSTPVQISSNDGLVAMVNQDSDSLSIFNTSGTSKTRSAVVDFGADTMPVSVAIHPDDQTAFVVLRRTKQLAKVVNINTLSPTVFGTRATVGAEPTGVALSPSGARAFVTNFGEGTVSIVDTSSMTVLSTVNVGGNPRAIAITNNLDGNDNDESAWVTQFFGTPIAEAVDTGRQGRVQEISLATSAVTNTVTLAPISDTGFGVGCAPNQLFGIAINNGKAYVTHVCVAPKGPVAKFNNVFAAVSVIDLATKAEDLTQAGTVALSKLISAQGTATSNLLGVPIGIDFRPNTNVAYVISQAGDTLQRIHYRNLTDGRGPIVLGPDSAFAQMNTRGTGGIKVPNGVAVAHSANFAYVANWADRSLTVIDLASQAFDSDIVSADKPTANTQGAHVLNGLKFFFTGTGRWSDRSVNSCGSCHPDGLSDQMTWVFGAGPRQSIPLDSSFAKTDPNDQRVFNWTGIFDEVHDFELNTRGTAGGKGAITTGTVPNDTPFDLAAGVSTDGGITNITRNDNLSGSTKVVVSTTATVKDWDEVEAYIKSIKSYRAPTPGADVAAGRALFQSNNCHQCHGGPKWTVSRLPYTPSPEKNGSAPGTNGLPAANTGMRTEARNTSLPNPAFNTDTLKIAAEASVTLFDGGVGNVGPERVTCVIRNVGTFDLANTIERKADGTQAQGIKGFNPPSLLSVNVGAPYFHQGSAKTLEDVFQPQFANHHQAGNANFLVNGGTTTDEQNQIRQLVAFLRSIDESTQTFTIPANQDICVNY